MSFKNLHLFLSLLMVIALLQCDNPFFPPTGVPIDVNGSILRDLQMSYKLRRIDKFEKLLYSKEEFRFYLEQNEAIVDSLQHIEKSQREKVTIQKDLDEPFISDDFAYVYLTYNEEIGIHTNLFRQATSIEFKNDLDPPYNCQYFPVAKTVGDTIVYDTLEMVLYTDENEITIESNKFIQIYGKKTFTFLIGKQVYFCKKDSAGKWKILYWFERKRKIS